MAGGQVLLLNLDEATLRVCRMALERAHDVELSAGDSAPDVVIVASPDAAAANCEAEIVAICEDPGAAMRAGAFYAIKPPIDPELLRAVVKRAVEIRRLRAAASENRDRLRRDLAEAARIQRAMLPAAEARLAAAGVSVALRCRPSAQVGGDLADYAEANGKAALLIADVAGHGLAAAMLTAVVKSAFADAVSSEFDPAAAVTRIQSGIRPFEQARFVTLIAARIDRSAATIEYVNAGHPPGLIFQRGQAVAELVPTAPLLLPGSNDSHVTKKLPLPANAGVLLFTDGVSDASGGDGRFGVARIKDAIARYPGGGAGLLDGILAAVDGFCAGRAAGDDLTLLTASIGLPGLG